MHGPFPSSEWQSRVTRIELARMKNDHHGQALAESPFQPGLNQPKRAETEKSAACKRNSQTSEAENAHRNTKQVSLPERSDWCASMAEKRCFDRKQTGIVMHVLKCELFGEPRCSNRIDRPAGSAKSTDRKTCQIAKHSKAFLEELAKPALLHLVNQVVSRSMGGDPLPGFCESFDGVGVPLGRILPRRNRCSYAPVSPRR